MSESNETEDIRTTCEPEKGLTCTTLHRFLNVPNSTAKGFHMVTRISLSDPSGDETFYGVAYRGGKTKAEYLMLNHCPWCGTALGVVKVKMDRETWTPISEAG